MSQQQPGPHPYPTAPPATYQPMPVATEDPARGMTITAMVLAFLFPFVGFVLGIVSYRKSSKVGYKNTLALVAIVISVVMWVVWFVVNRALMAAVV